MDTNEKIASCLALYAPNIGDNVVKLSKLYAYLKQMGSIKLADGGYEIREPLEYAKQTVENHDGESSPLGTNTAPALKHATFNWVYKDTPIKFTMKDGLSNASDAKIIDLLKFRTENAEKSMRDGVEEDWFSNGTGTGMKGSQYILGSTGDGTGNAVGGITQTNGSGDSDYTWCHYINTTGTAGFNSSNAGTILMSDCMSKTNYNGFVNLIATTPKIDSLYRIELIVVYRGVYPVNETMKNIGFNGIPEFMGAPIISSWFCPANKMYGYNTNNIFLRVDKNNNFRTSELKTAADAPHIQLAFVFFNGAITVNALRGHWLCEDITG